MKRPALPTVSRHIIAEWAVTLLVFLFGSATLVQAFVVPSGSMEGTLLIGDHVAVDKLAYAPSGGIGSRLLPYADVKRGDIVVFQYPLDISKTYVKRCIGVPGDRIRMREKRLFVNGVEQREPYVVHIDPAIDPARDSFPAGGGEIVMPEGHYFMLGDNRDDSADSRYWGLVPRANIVGKPLFVYWSFDAPQERLEAATPSLEHIADVTLHFFSRTRWRRTFHFIR
jgi:signal peptidase I